MSAHDASNEGLEIGSSSNQEIFRALQQMMEHDVEEEEELRPRQPRGPSNDLKLKPPLFVGKVDPEAYLDWERRMDNIFECYAYSDRRRVQYAAAQLAENALAWWDRETTERRRAHIEQVGTWREMKVLMRKRYVPPHFHRELQRTYRKLAQGARPVEEYFEEFEHIRSRLELEEDEETVMAQFLDGLQERIARKVKAERQDVGRQIAAVQGTTMESDETVRLHGILNEIISKRGA
ncbi:PREDICTED: uncharacterized protein LOC104815406 [Tarenaya hassleriana]|uniref:uncharacterized protein LOC104815406 n=1 Tax=Tarenaya hassleriana TaxID=28532 RepID=UPI00053C3039|nr:PREDICTED: uncharacterized protein LOC104815406 [Tarenaya hassleriana]